MGPILLEKSFFLKTTISVDGDLNLHMLISFSLAEDDCLDVCLSRLFG